MLSMKELAKYCGVSVATVSKALNNHMDISEETKNRIRKTADELGYYPNAAARSLKTNRTYNLGVLFVDEAHSGLTHEYFSAVLEGFKAQAERQGYDITFMNNHIGKKEITYCEYSKYRSLDGVIIACVDFNHPDVQELMNSNIPVVTIDYVHGNCTSILSDNANGMWSLCSYIYERGHRKIAYIHGQEHAAVTKTRLASFYRFAEENGLEIPDVYVKHSEYLETKMAAKYTKELLDMKNPPTCILYPDDTAIIGGINEITKRGLTIPEDISIAGYDGSKISQLLKPHITTVQQDVAMIGKKAAERLIKAIEKPKITLVKQILVEGKLLPGESVAKII